MRSTSAKAAGHNLPRGIDLSTIDNHRDPGRIA
jgi:hypothetical protein